MNIAFDGRAAAAAYTEAFRRFKEMPGFSPKLVLRAEAGVILKTWAGRTKVAAQETLTFRARSRAAKHVGVMGSSKYSQFPGLTINTGRKNGHAGEVWFRHPTSKKFQQAGLIVNDAAFKPSWVHWKSNVWEIISAGAEAYAAEVRRLKPATLRSGGLARQSVIQIADKLGIDLGQVAGGGNLSPAGISKARAAIASNGRAYQNGFGYAEGDTTKAYVDLIDTLPYGVKIGMDRVLSGVIAGRARFIETAYGKGAFDSMQSVARSFPNLVRVTGGFINAS